MSDEDEDDYRVTVTAGATNLHSFVHIVDAWFVADPPSRRQSNQWQRRLHPSNPNRPSDDGLTRAPWSRGPGQLSVGDLLDERRIPFARGVEPRGDTLAVVLDALRSGGRHRVDIADVKVVLSQLGSRITRLGSLPAGQRDTPKQRCSPIS